MDWEDKFTKIVRETEHNLAKAKRKLSSKAHNPLSSSCQDTLKPNAKRVSEKESCPVKGKIPHDYYASIDIDTSLASMSASSIQVLHMQEQINSQNRTIEKLKHLVKSLDGERDFYKEQIALLKGEVDLLTTTMKNKSSLVTPEVTMSNMKRDVMQEMEKVKSLVQSFEKDSFRRTPGPSPRFDPEFWNIKENLTTSLEQVRFELNEMKGRIGRMESQLVIDNLNRTKLANKPDLFQKESCNSYDYNWSRPLFTPTSNITPSVKESDLHHLRMAISSINSKLENIEKKYQNESAVFDEGNMRPLKSSPKSIPYHSRHSEFLFDVDDDLHSLSDPSDLSNISDGNDSDEDEVHLLDFDLGDNKGTCKPTATSSLLKGNYSKKGRVEFDLSDLDLSDIEEVEGVDLDSCSLDLDN